MMILAEMSIVVTLTLAMIVILSGMLYVRLKIDKLEQED